jgi:hypothetical protein
MPNDNGNDNVTSLVAYLNKNISPQQRQELHEKGIEIFKDKQIDYKILCALYEDIILQSLIKYDNSTQSKEILNELAISIAPLREKLLNLFDSID